MVISTIFYKKNWDNFEIPGDRNYYKNSEKSLKI